MRFLPRMLEGIVFVDAFVSIARSPLVCWRDYMHELADATGPFEVLGTGFDHLLFKRLEVENLELGAAVFLRIPNSDA